MTSENAPEDEPVEAAEPQPVKVVDDRLLIDELVSQAQSPGLQLTGESGLLQQPPERADRVAVCPHGDMLLAPTGRGRTRCDPTPEDRSERLRHHLRQPHLRSPTATPSTPERPEVGAA